MLLLMMPLLPILLIQPILLVSLFKTASSFSSSPTTPHSPHSPPAPMQDALQLRFKAKEAMEIATARENAGKFTEAAEAYRLAADICCRAKVVAVAAKGDAKAMKDAEVPPPPPPLHYRP